MNKLFTTEENYFKYEILEMASYQNFLVERNNN